jgi:hypothetical protein
MPWFSSGCAPINNFKIEIYFRFWNEANFETIGNGNALPLGWTRPSTRHFLKHRAPELEPT